MNECNNNEKLADINTYGTNIQLLSCVLIILVNLVDFISIVVVSNLLTPLRKVYRFCFKTFSTIGLDTTFYADSEYTYIIWQSRQC